MVVVFPISGHLKLKEPTLWVHVFEHTSTSHQSFSSISFEKDYDAIWRIRIEVRLYRPFVPTSLTQKFAGNWPTWPSWNGTMTFLINNKMNEWKMSLRWAPPLAPCSFWCIHSLRATSGPAIIQITTISLHYYKYHGEVWTISLSKEAGETK